MNRLSCLSRSCHLAMLLAAISGCGLAEVERVQVETEEVARQVTALRGSGPGAPQAGRHLSTVRLIEHRPYVELTRIETDARADLPARFRGTDAVTLPLADIGDVAELAGRIEAATGLTVRFIGPPRPADNSNTRNIRGGTRPAGIPGAAGRDNLSPDGGIWTGPLDALLSSWTEPSGYDWRFDKANQSIEIVRRQSAVFHIHALAGKQNYTISASTRDNAAGGEEAGGGANLTSQSISAETEYDPWPEIEGQLKELLEPGTRLSIAPSSASVTVSGVPRDIARTRAFLGYLNREVLRPVTLSVHVYSVRVEREADYGMGLSFSIARLLGTALRVSAAANSVALIKPGGDDAGGGDTLSATVRALNRAGAVSRVLSADIPSLNGKPAQFFELFKEAYLREQRTTVAEGVAQTELVPGTVSSGFAVSYLPRITGPGEVLVRLFASLRDRPSFAAFTSNSQTIQLPAYASRAIQVTQKIGRGETLMVTGFSDRSASAGRSGTFDADVPLPDGGRNAAAARIEQVLLVTADIGAPLGIAEVRGMAF